MLKLLGAAGVLAGGGAGLVRLLRREEPASELVEEACKRVALSEHPSPNPAFEAMELHAGGLLLWASHRNGALLAYRLNGTGRILWWLCDGQRSREQIAAEYSSATGRPAAEAPVFLQQLRQYSVIVEGGYISVAPDAPHDRLRLFVFQEGPGAESAS